MWNAVAAVAIGASAVLAAPTIVYPLADQSPPVGRVDAPFNFALLPGTFSSTDGTITYTASGLPAWASFDANVLSLYGSPAQASDVGQQTITITATDSTGSTTDTFNLIVSDNASPAVHRSISTQIADPSLHNFATAEALASNGGVSIHPYYSFSLGFQQDTFRPAYDATQRDIFYSAHERGNTVLPSWLTFDNRTVTFYGTAPAEGSYTIVVDGSDIWGYSAAMSSFVIEVTTSAVDFVDGSGLAAISTVAGAMVEYAVNLTGLTVDGQLVNGAAGVTVQANLDDFSWLHFDQPTLSLSGTTPVQYINGTSSPLYLPVSISATNATTATTSTLPVFVPISIRPSLFTTLTLGNASATPGTAFEFALSSFVRNASAIAAINSSSTASSALSSWVSFNSKTLTLSGTVPNTSALSARAVYRRADAVVPLTIAATEVGTGLVSTATLDISLAGVTAPSTTASSSATATNTSGGSSSKSKGGLSKAGKIALGVVFGLLGLILLVVLLVCCCRRRRKDKTVEEKRKRASDGDSFMGIIKSPKEKLPGFRFIGTNKDMPRSGSGRLQHGEMPTFQSLVIQRENETAQRPTAAELDAAEEPRRMGAMTGIMGWAAHNEPRKSADSHVSFPPIEPQSPAPGEIISQTNIWPPSQGGSDFTHDFTSGSDSRASWESRGSFHWSSGDGQARPNSGVPSIPRPRQDFTPRYPRNASPAALAALVRPPSSAGTGHTFSEFHSDDDHSHSHSGSGSGSHSLSPQEQRSPFTQAPSGLGRFTDQSGYFSSVREEDEDGSGSDHSGGMVHVAQRRSAAADDEAGPSHRQPRLMPSKERFGVSPTTSEFPEKQRTPSQEAIAGQEENSDAFDDADEEERQRDSVAYVPSQIGTDLQGLGYPASAIYFGSPPRETKRDREPSIRAIAQQDVVLSPPLPQPGTLMQQLDERDPQLRAHNPKAVMHDGRYVAQSNQNFNLHPQIHPPPVVSLSAATWSSAPPSVYRAEPDAGAKPLPAWLHFDAKELELWGIPSLRDEGEIFTVRIIERKPPREKRKSYDSSQVMKDETIEREVARVTIEVMDGMKSPGDAFSLDGYGSPPPITL